MNAIDREVDYVDAGDDDEEGGDTIPGDVCSLLKKVTNGPNEDVDTSNDSLSDSDQLNADADTSDDEDAPDWEFDLNEK